MNTRRLFLTYCVIASCLICNAQNDSIAISQMKEVGVYYFDGPTFKQMSPILPEGSKGSIGILKVSGSLEYLGENSENVFNNSPEFYIYIPSVYKNRMNVKQFRMVTLVSKKGIRKLKIVSANMLKGKTGAKTTVMETKKLNEECYKLYLSEPIEEGHYGIFYNYGQGVPGKLYDFDVINK